jgi:hypothetical protein
VNLDRVRLVLQLEFLVVWLSVLRVELDLIFDAPDRNTTLPTKVAITLTLSITMSADATSTLRYAEEAINAINTINTWKSAVNILKRIMDTVTPIAGVTSILFLLILRRANLRIVAEPLCKSSMGSALKDSRGASPCLVRLAEHLLFFHLAARLCFSWFSVTRMSKPFSRPYEMRSSLWKKPTF